MGTQWISHASLLVLAFAVGACSGGGTTTDTFSGGACDDANDEPSSGSGQSIVVINATDQPIFVQYTSDCSPEPVTFTGASGRIRWNGDGLESCESLLAAGECEFFGCTNLIRSYQRVDPQSSWSIPWAEYELTPVDVDGACLGDACTNPTTTCLARRNLELGASITVEAVAFTDCAEGVWSCTCPGGESTCTLEGEDNLGGTQLMASQGFSVGDEGIALTFE